MIFLFFNSLWASNDITTGNMHNAEASHLLCAFIIMGPSCAGKSTLAKKVLEAGSDNWKMIELDVIEDDLKKSQSDYSQHNLIKVLTEQANKALKSGHSVIIDTNIYSEELEIINAGCQIKILVTCPLEILIDRNSKRNVRLKRSKEKAQHALEWVEKTHKRFEDKFLRSRCDWCFDSSCVNTEKMCRQLGDTL